MISENDTIQTNSMKAWLLAARPKTLSAAAVPVIIGFALALKTVGWREFQVVPALLCLLFAWLMQIDSNLINDYFDFVRGNDDRETRLGPKRACAEGWITLPAMRWALAITSVSACVVGLPLIAYGGWNLVGVGALCVVFAFLYTTFFASKGLGDVLVVVFFGLVPVYFTWFVIVPAGHQAFNLSVLCIAIACGMVIDTLLLVNNYRDRDNDKACGKITLAVRLGERATPLVYRYMPYCAELWIFQTLILGEDAPLWKVVAFVALAAVYLIMHDTTARKMVAIGKGRELNAVLGMTARNLFVFGLVTAAQILFVGQIL